jgi:hypothetical protein
MTRPALNGGKECPDLIQLGRGKYYVVTLKTITSHIYVLPCDRLISFCNILKINLFYIIIYFKR